MPPCLALVKVRYKINQKSDSIAKEA